MAEVVDPMIKKFADEPWQHRPPLGASGFSARGAPAFGEAGAAD
jgi:hypothetical protein